MPPFKVAKLEKRDPASAGLYSFSTCRKVQAGIFCFLGLCLSLSSKREFTRSGYPGQVNQGRFAWEIFF